MCQRQLRRNRRPCESSLPCDSCGKGEAGQEKGYERLGGFVPGWEDKKETFSFAAGAHTDTSVRACTRSTVGQSWRRSFRAAPRALPQLPTTCRICPTSGLSAPFRRLGNVAGFPASRSAQTDNLLRSHLSRVGGFSMVVKWASAGPG